MRPGRPWVDMRALEAVAWAGRCRVRMSWSCFERDAVAARPLTLWVRGASGLSRWKTVSSNSSRVWSTEETLRTTFSIRSTARPTMPFHSSLS